MRIARGQTEPPFQSFCDPENGLAFGLRLNAPAMDLIGYGRTARLAEAARQWAEALV